MRRHTRPGLSLTEVLVAMFVMALGLMALLTLFPLGALQIGQALKDDRTAQTTEQADSWTRVWWKGEIAAYLRNGQPSPEPLAAALDDPNLVSRQNMGNGVTLNTYAAGNYSTPLNLTIRPRPTVATDIGKRIELTGADISADVLADPAGLPALPADDAVNQYRYAKQSGGAGVPSYPVLLDPLGYLARSTLARGWAGKDSVGATGGVYGVAPGAMPTLLPRRNTLQTPGPSPNAAFKACALTDDLTYQPNGGAGQTLTDPNTGVSTLQQLSRQGRYTWAAVVQRSNSGQPDVADLTVLVFDGRPPFLGTAGDEVVLVNDPVNNIFFHNVVAGTRSVQLNTPPRGADQLQLVRRGGWIAVANLDSPATPGGGVRGVTFHRVTGLTTLDDTTMAQYSGGPTISVRPLALDIDPPVGPVGANPQVILFSGLSEVFNRAPMLP